MKTSDITPIRTHSQKISLQKTSPQKRNPAMTATIDPLLALPARHTHRRPVARQSVSYRQPVAHRHTTAVPRPHGATRAQVRPRPSEAVFRRRRRAVGAVLALLGALTAFLFIGPGAVATQSTPDREQAPRTVIVQRGDTIWDIARTLVPTGPVGDLVTELIRLNGTRLEPGQVVRLP